MKKSSILIVIFIVMIIIASVVGMEIVTGDTKIAEEIDIFTLQTNKEAYFSPYGYTLDNPNIIVNPYGNSPLTALVMFETPNYIETSIVIKGKSEEVDISYSFGKDKYHLIPIYGLYADYNNTVIIKCGNEERIINIQTDELPSDFEFVNDISINDNFYFSNTNYPYAYDKNNDVRWFLNSSYYGNISVLDNSRIIIGSDRYDENGEAISVYEMNFLGKVYTEYNSKYYGYNTIYHDNLVILSDDLLEIDRQTGNVINSYPYSDNIDYIGVSSDNIVVKKEDAFYEIIDGKLEDTDYQIGVQTNSFYYNTVNYKIVPPSRYGILPETIKSDKSISLVKYEKIIPDDIILEKEFNRLKVVNNTGDKLYIILDKFFDKRIYEVDDILYINDTGLSGKYTVYFKREANVYKTDYLLEV